jgi:predicted amidohydrolase
MSRVLRLALCQVASDIASDGIDPRPANLARAESCIRRAADEGANLALFGEVYLNGYRSDAHLQRYSSTVDPPDGDIRRLIELSRETGVFIAMGISRRGPTFPGNLFNSAVLVGPDGLIGHYDKVHVANFELPSGRLVLEGVYWDIGRQFRVFDLPWARVGLQICRDVRYPEASRQLTLMGAEVIINLSAAAAVRTDSWQYFALTRAAENQVWFAMTSVVGQQKDDQLFGGSRVISPTGELIARAKDNQEDFCVVDLDLDEVTKLRAMSHVLDRRVPSAYSAITAPLGPDS